MKILFQFFGAAAIAATGAAIAQPAVAPHGDRNAPVTRQQVVERVDQRFQRLDLDHDGRFTPEEARQGGEQRRAQFADRMFDRLDLDHNGSVTREEMNQARAQHQAQRAERGEGHGPGMGGHRGGMGGRGRFMRAMHHGGPGMGARLFGEQGFVTRDQMRERALAHFDRVDADHDGTLTPTEREQAHRQMREHFRERMEEQHPVSN